MMVHGSLHTDEYVFPCTPGTMRKYGQAVETGRLRDMQDAAGVSSNAASWILSLNSMELAAKIIPKCSILQLAMVDYQRV